MCRGDSGEGVSFASTCAFAGDKVEKFLGVAGGYDGYVFGSPVYYAGMAGSMKAFMDRAFYGNRGRVTFALKPIARRESSLPRPSSAARARTSSGRRPSC